MLHLPTRPEFDDALIQRCTESKYVTPIVFEWYKHIAQIAYILASIPRDSVLLRLLPNADYAVLIGLLARCSRLMLSVVKMSASGVHGETVRILDRCIVESAVKLQWLCTSNKADKFARYMKDAIRHEVKLRDEIQDRIHARGGSTLKVEQQMLNSVSNTINASGLSENMPQQIKGMPDFRAICKEIGLNDLFYIVAQELGSHSVHGSWSDLVQYYLDQDSNGYWKPRENDAETSHLQFIFVATLVAEATIAFSKFAFNPQSLAEELENHLSQIRDELLYWLTISESDDYASTDNGSF